MLPVVRTKALTAASANNIALSQTPLAAGNLTLAGSAVVGGIAVLDTQRRVLITCGGADSGRSFTVYGTNKADAPISETVAGSNVGTTATQRDFKTVTRVAVDAATAGTVTVGTNTVGSIPWVGVDIFRNPDQIGMQLVVSGTVTYQVEYTYDDFEDVTIIPLAWVATMPPTGTAVSAEANFAAPVRGVRFTILSGTGSVTSTIIQSGLRGA